MAEVLGQDLTEELNNHPDLSQWMQQLPKVLHDISINWLAIPGSHDSFTFYLDKTGPVAPDEPLLIRRLGEYFGRIFKGVVYNWSTVQSLSIAEQLRSGIRYFDVRLASKSDCTDLYCVHGLYGPCIEDCLSDIELFLNDHKQEIVLIDFNHFYGMSDELHLLFIKQLIDRFGQKLCPVSRLGDVTLNFMWNRGYQLIIFYHKHSVKDFPELWPGCSIQSPWPNTVSVTKLLEILQNQFDRGRTDTTFFVTQGVLTPTFMYVLYHITSNLKQSLGKVVGRPFVDWVKEKTAGRCGINICILDFVEEADYTESIVRLNYRLAC